MTAYIFVLGIWNHEERELRFEHFVLMASSVDEAYELGGQQAKERGLVPVAQGESANDYVIELVAH